MALNKTLNATCDLGGYLFCRMPEDTLEIEVKIKTKWGKCTMFQDTYTWREKYHSWDRADRRSSVHTRRRRTPQREVIVSSHDNTNSETDVPVGQGLGYPLQVFTDPEFAADIPHTEEEEEVYNDKFIGNYCETCAQCGETRCWCNSSDWGEQLVDVENPNANPTLENKTPSPKSVRKPPAGWPEFRRRTISKAMQENNRQIVIENCKTISKEEYNNNSM